MTENGLSLAGEGGALCVLYWLDRLPGARPAADPELSATPGRP